MRSLLDIKLFTQTFSQADVNQQLDDARGFARLCAQVENGIGVLSDLKARKSYIYSAGLAEQLGVKFSTEEINSVWEDELLSRIHSDDLEEKYRLEFNYFQMLKAMPPAQRQDYGVVTRLRIKNDNQQYITVVHRLFYVGNLPDGSIWLALCLYNRDFTASAAQQPYGVIINTRRGEVIEGAVHEQTQLSARENEVLSLMQAGKRSKEIAAQLLLSINTVNRHRQNIFKKLKVSNVVEACLKQDLSKGV